MNEFQQKREARVARYRLRAGKLFNEAHRLMCETPESKTLAGMAGEPIKIGHHSEGRHRRLIQKVWNQMGRACDMRDQAARLESRAEAIESSTAVYSDDPDAIAKLQDELRSMEARQALMKQVNAAHRAYLKKPGSLDTSDLPASAKQQVIDYKPERWQPHPFPPYSLSNLSANIRRVRDRIAQLVQREQVAEATPGGRRVVQETEKYRIVEDFTENRLMLSFTERPSKEQCKLLRTRGFKWSPTRTAWVRFLGNHSTWAAQAVVKTFFGES
jgi:G3E family GTPase